MKFFAIGSSIAAVLMLAGMSAHASCTDPRMGDQGIQNMPPVDLHQPSMENHWHREGAAEMIVGTWHVTYTSNGKYFAQAFMQWHRDRTEWEHITQPVLGGNICMGSWKVVDA